MVSELLKVSMKKRKKLLQKHELWTKEEFILRRKEKYEFSDKGKVDIIVWSDFWK